MAQPRSAVTATASSLAATKTRQTLAIRYRRGTTGADHGSALGADVQVRHAVPKPRVLPVPTCADQSPERQ